MYEAEDLCKVIIETIKALDSINYRVRSLGVLGIVSPVVLYI